MLIWTIAGVAIAFVGVVLGIFGVIGYFKAHPKRQLSYAVTSRPLISRQGVAKLHVLVDEIPVADPYFVEIRLWSNSRADIPSSAFDGGTPITMRIAGASHVVVATEAGITLSEQVHGWDDLTLSIDPALIKPRASLSIDLVVDGDPEVTLTDNLIDINIKPAPDRRALSEFALSLMTSGALPFSLPIKHAWDAVQGRSANEK